MGMSQAFAGGLRVVQMFGANLYAFCEAPFRGFKILKIYRVLRVR